MFCGDLPVLWCQGVWEDEVLCQHIPDIYFGDRGIFVRMWVSVQPAFDAAYEYTAKYIFRFGALPEYLYRRAYFSVSLQYMYRCIHRSGRFQDTPVFIDRFITGEYCP